MITYLGSRTATGVVDNSGNNPYGVGNYTATLSPKTFAVATNQFEIYHMALIGPSGSQFRVYIDTAFYSASFRGDINEWDPNETMHLLGGQNVYFYWNTGTGTAPMVTAWIRTSGLS